MTIDVLTLQARNLQDQPSQLTPAQKALLEQYPHYYKDISKLAILDVYRVLELFGVTDACAQHSIKKLLCAGVRGAKDVAKDFREARDTLNRKLLMVEEDTQDAMAAIRMAAAPAEHEGLAPHEVRVMQELATLSHNVAKLEEFQRGEQYRQLEPIERNLLVEQLQAMHSLKGILQRRVTLFKTRAEQRKREAKA